MALLLVGVAIADLVRSIRPMSVLPAVTGASVSIVHGVRSFVSWLVALGSLVLVAG